MQTGMVDVHAHLCFDTLAQERERVAAACEAEMAAVIVGSARYDEGLCALGLASRHKRLFPTIGYHPVEGGTGVDDIIRLARKSSRGIVGIGEVGLDHHWEKDPARRLAQKKVFSRFISLASELGKPLVIRSWDAEAECFEMVRDVDVPVVFHCYSGPRELATQIIGCGFYISFSTQVLFSKSSRKLARDVPLDRMVLETDSPFLSPYGYLRAKGHEDLLKPGFDPEKNYPWNVRFSAEKIAEIKGVGIADVISRTAGNASRIFGLQV